jgi:hypothetical protein
MGASSSYRPQVSQAYINGLVATAIANSSIPTQAPEFSTPPLNYQNGQIYRNTTNGFLYVMENGIFVRVDTKEGIILQDLSGNQILTD